MSLSWGHREVALWLKSLSLEEYVDVFIENDVRGDILLQINSKDLISIGISKFGHRKIILNSLNGMRDKSPNFTKAQLNYNSRMYKMHICKNWGYLDLIDEIISHIDENKIKVEFQVDECGILVYDDHSLQTALNRFECDFNVNVSLVR